MFILKSCTFCHIQRTRLHRLLSWCSPSAPLQRTKPLFEPFNTHFRRSTRSFMTASAMPKPKRRPAATAIPPPAVVASVSVSTNDKEQPYECLDILDGELARAVPPHSLGLSSPPVSVQEESGRFIREREIAIPVSGKRSGGKQAPVASRRKSSGGDGGGIADECVRTSGNGTAGKTTKVKERPQAKKKKTNENDEEMRSEVEGPEERPPPVNSDYVPIPWKGRLGYACLNTYLRFSNPPIFCSRTCRIDTILKHGIEGQKYVESLGLANARDLVKLIHWNERYGIKFLRISSEMFPFASHPVYGYSLAFAKDVLAEAGKAAMGYGHRLSMHPGQFTQFGSPRKEVVENAVRDVEYHAQLLGYLGLTGQADKDAVMILHMGGTFGDKEATLQRFRKNYALLSPQVKARLVLENDDMCWSVHDLLPFCKELNIPLVLDWHHHNLIRDACMREGSLDILQLIPEIKETWTRKGITQKQHYSEPKDDAVTHMERRRHSSRVLTLPPCEDTMDLMIEAKDKEQAVFELMKKFKIPGWKKIQNVIPHVREDENKPEPKKKAVKAKKLKKTKRVRKKKAAEKGEGEEVEQAENQLAEGPVLDSEPTVQPIAEEEIGMGGADGRVYWPEGKEDWLSPPKRVRIKKTEAEAGTVDCAEEEAEANEKKPKKVAKKTKGNTAVEIEAEEYRDQEVDREIAPATPHLKRAKRAKKASAPAVAGSIIPPPTKVSRKRKPPVIKMEEQNSEVTLALAASRKRKLGAVNTENMSMTQIENGEVGQRRSTRIKKAVAYMELLEEEIGMEAEA